ncbi:MAG: translocation/assembly module TamB domain-containing protein, partial [Myxococcota bacterium]
LRVAALALRGIGLGDGELTIEPGADATRVRARLLDNRLRADAYLTLRPRASLSGQVDLDRIDLTSLLPDARKHGVVEAPATARLVLAWDAERGLHSADATVKLLRATLRERGFGDADGAGETVTVRNRGPLRVSWRDGRATVEAAEFVSAAGSFDIGGWLERERSDLVVRGRLRLEVLQVFLRRWLDSIQGEARVDLRVTGPMRAPLVVGTVDLYGAFLLPRNIDKAVYLPQGSVQIEPTFVAVRSLLVQFGDAMVRVDGRLGHAGFQPTDLDVRVEGSVPADLIAIALPEYVSSGSGLLEVSARAYGAASAPTVVGQIAPKGVEIVPRRLGRTIDLDGGLLRFAPDGIVIEHVVGRIDDGDVSLDGRIALHAWRPASVDLHVRGTNLPHRVPRRYEAEVNVDLTLRGGEDRLALAGRVELVDARYRQDFEYLNLIFKPKVVEEEEPFWTGLPLLEGMSLDLHVVSTGAAAVDNNIASISLDVAIDVGGTLAAPHLHGEIRPVDGTFRIPLMPPTFAVQRGVVTFRRGAEILDAVVVVAGETIVEDVSGAEHTIDIDLSGTLRQIKVKFEAPGLDQGQVLSLIAFGRTTEQLRAAQRDPQASGEVGAGARPTGGIVDEQLQEISSEVFSVLADPISKGLSLDTASLGVGAQSVTGLFCKKFFGARVEGCYEADLYLQGGARQEGRGDLRLSDHFMLEAKWEQLTQSQDTQGEDLSLGKLQLVGRYVLR